MGQILPSQEGSIYKLAQSGTTKFDNDIKTAVVTGIGTDISDFDKLKKRAKRKVITDRLMIQFVNIAKDKGDFDRVAQYWRTYNCQKKLIRDGNIVFGDYCKNKFCNICTANRKALLINLYKPVLEEWNDIHFVTLTVKSCKECDLKFLFDACYKAMRITLNRLKKRHQRGKGIKVMGIKSFECNFNPITKSYNPHFHLLVPSKEIAQLLMDEWLTTWKPKDGKWRKFYAGRKGQDMRPLKNLEDDLIETIKYGAKIFIDPDMKKKKKASTSPLIYAYALDNIYAAMKSRRLFDRFGFDLPPQPIKENSEKTVRNPEVWKYSVNDTDWINKDTGECLSGYSMPPELEYLITQCFNTTLH